MMAQVCGLETGEFIHTFGDVHIYKNHFEQVEQQLERQPRDTPKLFLNPDINNIFEFDYKDFAVIGYDPHPAIKAEVAV
jgi:thymidylate synthase